MTETVTYLGLADLAARAGISKNTADSYRSGGYLPEPDALITSNGRVVRGWLPETVDAWLANRPGRGARTDLHPRS